MATDTLIVTALARADAWSVAHLGGRLLAALLLLAPGALPLFAWPVPFQDSLGHMGVIGALHWLGADPSMLDPTLQYQGLLGPNRLFYVIPGLLSPILGPDMAARAGYVFALASVAPAAALGLHLAGRSAWWALAVPPIVLGRILACGFVPNVLALGPLAVCIGAALAPRMSARVALAGLVAGSLCLAAHVFVGLAAASFFAVAAVVDLTFRRWPSSAVKAGTVLFILGLQLGPLAGPKQESLRDSGMKAVVAAIDRPHLDRFERAWTWSFPWMTHVKWDDRAHGVWLLALLIGALARPLRWPSGSTAASHVALALFALGTLWVLTSVDENIGPPFNWWGGWLRAPIILSLLLVFAAAAPIDRATRLARGGLFGAVTAGGLFVLVTIGSVRKAAVHEYEGLEHVLAHAPDKKRMCAMWFGDDSKLQGFPGSPHWYAGNLYLLEHGGNAAHSLLGDPAYPIYRGPKTVETPGWGHAWGFRYAKHFGWCELFLVRIDPRNPDRPFPSVALRQLRLVAARGRWRLWQKQG